MKTEHWRLFSSFVTEDWRVKNAWRDCAFPQPIGAWQLDHGGDILFQCMHFVTIVKSVLKSRFCAISSDFNDFTRFQPDFTHFRFFQTIQHVKHVLTRKIIRFYESKRDFNNLALRYCDIWCISLDSSNIHIDVLAYSWFELTFVFQKLLSQFL